MPANNGQQYSPSLPPQHILKIVRPSLHLQLVRFSNRPQLPQLQQGAAAAAFGASAAAEGFASASASGRFGGLPSIGETSGSLDGTSDSQQLLEGRRALASANAALSHFSTSGPLAVTTGKALDNARALLQCVSLRVAVPLHVVGHACCAQCCRAYSAVILFHSAGRWLLPQVRELAGACTLLEMVSVCSGKLLDRGERCWMGTGQYAAPH